MMSTNSPRERKLVAVGLLAVAVALIHFLIVDPLLGGFADRSKRRQLLLQQYIHNDRAIAAIPRLSRRAEQQRAELRQYTLAARDPVLAADLLQERLRLAVEGAGGEFRASSSVAAAPGLVRANASARLSLDQITRVLGDLQNQPPYLVVESLRVAADEALVNGHLNPMDVDIEVSIPFSPARA